MMSTASEIGRMPAFWRRRRSQIGERASGLRPLTVRAVKRSQPKGSATSTGWPSALGPGTSRRAGSRSGRP
ncbi:hypothetical protein SF12_10255 [Streptomyces sp. MBRL 601]|nr:hypothetical protein SF12_10255 [Streptomyces sp. MBRL 601]